MGKNDVILLTDDPEATARMARLRYVDCDGPGIRRKKWGRGFTYLNPEGEHIQDPAQRERFETLVIPPAWNEVWICPDTEGHIQVTGRDDKGRKQYIYHSRWQEARSQTKFNRMVLFAQALPALREQIDKDLRKHGTPRERVLAAMIRLLQESLIRVGNEEYARKNQSYGLTTLHSAHLELTGNKLHFEFKGKSNKMQDVDVRDARVARVLQQLQELPGQELFQYVDHEGQQHAIGSHDVNDYVRAATDQDFTAKDFRTWGGTVHASCTLQELGPAADEKDAHKKVVEMYRLVSDRLGNTPAVCREYYVHPAIVELYIGGEFFDLWQASQEEKGDDWLEPDEQTTLYLLSHHLTQP